MNASQLRDLITKSLTSQGFRLRAGEIFPPRNLTKERLRKLHSLAVKHRIAKSEGGLSRHEDRLLGYVAAGAEVNPELIAPRIVEVAPGSEEELLFRHASLHWSIPVSSGYGRRLRFIVFDEHNGKLIGLIGLGDPIFSLGARDHWIGWDMEARKQRLYNVLDAFVLGAVPPYSALLCGKLVAMLASSNEVRGAFERKYGSRKSLIGERKLDRRLALITTTSALGRSSVYNRIRYEGRTLFKSVGFTQGSGDFHFANGLYDSICQYAVRYCQPTAKQERWGIGFRNRREVVRKCLAKIGLSHNWAYHGVRREVFVVPLAKNTQQFLAGQHSRLQWFDQPATHLFAAFRERWLLPRASRDQRYRDFIPSSYRLWSKETNDDG
jgi:hypothetical protein